MSTPILNLWNVCEDHNNKLNDEVTFPYHFDLNWDIKSLSEVYREHCYLNIKAIDEVIDYLKENYNLQFEELIERRNTLINNIKSDMEYLKTKGDL